MILYIDDEVFADTSIDPLTLPTLFSLADRRKHRLQTLPVWDEKIRDSKIAEWLAKQPAAPRFKEILKRGLEEDSKQFECDVLVRVRKNPRASSQQAVELTAEEALEILLAPFEVLVEHFRNDWHFLKLLAGEWSELLTEHETAGFIKVRHGGGDTLRDQVEKVAPLRSFVLFDSDSKLPASASEEPRPSAWSEEVRLACERRRIAYHQLRRRAAENYLPKKALDGWTWTLSSRLRKLRRATLAAFFEMSARQRHYYHLREGMAKDCDDPCLVHFGEFAHRPELEKGFGNQVRDLFLQQDFAFDPGWIKNECGEEARELTLKLLRRL